jgi:hypothetical protein
MGNICPCLKGSGEYFFRSDQCIHWKYDCISLDASTDSSDHEYTPVPTSAGVDGGKLRRDGEHMSSDQYYQSVIEDARGYFFY